MKIKNNDMRLWSKETLFLGLFLVSCSKQTATMALKPNAAPLTPQATAALAVSYQAVGGAVDAALSTPYKPLLAGTTYQFNLQSTGMDTGVNFKMWMTPTGLTLNNPQASAPTTPVSVTPGTSVTFKAPAVFGDYLMSFGAYDASGKLILQKGIPISVACANPNPNFTAANVSGAKIEFIPGSFNDRKPNFSSFQITGNGTRGVAGLVPGGNGGAGYGCALDQNGVGIIDTGSQDCVAPFGNLFSNYVGTRVMGLLVTDLACNNSVVVQVPTSNIPSGSRIPVDPRTPPFNLELGGGTSFIYGELRTTATDPIPADPAVYNVNYLSVASSGNGDVKGGYVPDSRSNQASVYLNSVHLYGMPSSVPYGMSFTIGGLTDNIPRSNPVIPPPPAPVPSGSPVPSPAPSPTPIIPVPAVDTSRAWMNLKYTTDQNATSLPRVDLNWNCTLDSIKAVPGSYSTTTCDGGQLLAFSIGIEVSGEFHCDAPRDKDPGYGGSKIQNGFFDTIVYVSDACPAPAAVAPPAPPIPAF